MAIEPETSPTSVQQATINALLKSIKLIEQGVASRDRMMLQAASKHDMFIRSNLSKTVLLAFIPLCTVEPAQIDMLNNFVNVLDAEDTQVSVPEDAKASSLPETFVYAQILVAIYLLDNHQRDQSLLCIKSLMETLAKYNRRTLDPFSAKTFFFYALIHDINETSASIRTHLLALYRTACLHHDEPSQGMLINLILKNYLQANLYTQADQFMLNTVFPESNGNYQHARYLYFKGRIHAVQLNYSEALDNLTQALRRAPQKAALGFRQHVSKMLILVKLLMGSIPLKTEFRGDGLERSLSPYYQIAQAVRTGDLSGFNRIQERFKDIFAFDRTYNLITRLRRNVLKAALRKINSAYSKISIQEITERLGLKSVEDAEYIISKAIHDGVMDATLHHEEGIVCSNQKSDMVSSGEPQEEFHRRIKFCLDIHNEAVKALRYPEEIEEGDPKPSFLDVEDLLGIEILEDLKDDDMMD